MTAKEMFEEIGYEMRDHHLITKPQGMFPQDEPYLEYWYKDEIFEQHIKFRAYAKSVEITVCIYNKHKSPAELGIKELAAITKQCAELGWISEEENEFN